METTNNLALVNETATINLDDMFSGSDIAASKDKNLKLALPIILTDSQIKAIHDQIQAAVAAEMKETQEPNPRRALRSVLSYRRAKDGKIAYGFSVPLEGLRFGSVDISTRPIWFSVPENLLK